ncbi:MAG: ABC transporter substrate-binding protein [Ferruginibacter sp.]
MFTIKPISYLCLLLAVSTLYCGNIYAQSSKDSIRLHLKWWHQFQFAGYYAADIKGFYKQAGLNVKIIPADKNHPPIQAVTFGNADFGVSGSDIIVDHASGKNLVVLGAIFQHSPYAIISLRSKNINVPTDLIGKRIMASKDQGWVQLQALFLKEGIPLDSLKVIRHTWNNEDLIDDYADAMTGYVSVEPYQLEKKGQNLNIMLPANYGIDFYGDVLFTTKKMVNKSPKMVEKFREASFKGWEYALDNVDEIATYILTLPGVKERKITMEDLLFEATEMKKLILPEMVEIGHQNEGRWQHILNIHKELGLINKDITLEDFIYNPVKNESSRLWRILMISGIIAAVLLLIIMGYSISLRKAVRKRTTQLQKEIKERATTQEKLSISEERLEMATRAAGVGIWDWNIENNSIYLSDSLAYNLGFEPGSLPDDVGLFKNMVHPADADALVNNIRLQLAGELEELNTVIRIKSKTGEWKWILMISKAVKKDVHQKALRLMGIHLNVDELKNKEIVLSDLSKELLKRNAELQQFAYITSHNLRAPVANLISLTQLFRKDELAVTNGLYFSKISECIHILDETISDVNTILSLSSAHEEKPELVDLQKLLNQVSHSISEKIQTTHTEILADFSQAPMLLFSKKILHSVFQNLITNSIKYRKVNEPVQIIINSHKTEEAYIINVADNGTGIDLTKDGHKVFQLFQRFHSGIEGKGLGLYIIKSQLESLNGKIEIQSTKDQGTSFMITIPK